MATPSAKDKILDAAESLVFSRGFVASTLDKIIDDAGVTKGALFYHFDSKGDLGRALVERFAERDRAVLDDVLAAAAKASDDPLQRLLTVVALVERQAEADTETSGCLFASFIYERLEYPSDVGDIAHDAMLRWREALGVLIEAAAATRPPTEPVDADDLADMFSTVVEGGYVMARLFDDPGMLARHLGHFRRYLRLLFADDG